MATKQQITELYQKYLGRDPEQAGLYYWMNSGESLESIEWNIANSKEGQERSSAINTALTALANSPDTMGLGLQGMFSANKPDPVVQGTDGQYYLSNPQLTTNGWITNPDYSTPVYFFHQPIEVGEARGNYATYSEDYRTATQQGNWFTEDQIKSFWDGTFDTGTLNMDVFREQHPDMTFDQYMSFVSENSALYAQGLTPESNPEMFSDLTNKYGIKTSFAGESGHVYGWNGSNYTKTFHADKSLDTGGIIMSLAVAAMTGGLANEGLLGSFVQGLSGYQRAAVINGAMTAVQTGGDLKAIAGSVVGTLAGGKLGSFVDLGSAAANSALSSSISSAFEQAIVNGEIDFETVLSSGVLGAGAEIAKDLAEALIKGTEFDFGGLISQDSQLFGVLNGEYDLSTGKFTGGLIGNVRGAYNQFVEQYITGGDWWENATESYDSVDIYETAKGKYVDLVGYDGKTTTLAWNDFVSQGFDEVSGSSALWDSISGAMDSIPDSWYDTLWNWMQTTSRSTGGTYTTEGGSTVTVTTTGTDDTGDGGDATSGDFNCSSVNRQQVAGATKEEECGGCLEGYQSDEFGICTAVINKVCPAGQAWNDVIGDCVDEIFYTPGSPCNMEDGTQGVFDDNGDCIFKGTGTGGDGSGGGDGTGGKAGDACTVEETKEAGTLQDDGQGNLTCVATGTGGKAGDACTVEETKEAGTLQDDGQGNLTCVATGTGTGGTGSTGDTRKAGDACTDDATNKQGTLQEDAQGNLICVVAGDTTTVDTGSTTTKTCSDPDRATKEDGSCAELCKDGTIPDQHEEGLCGNPLIKTTGPGGNDVDCSVINADNYNLCGKVDCFTNETPGPYVDSFSECPDVSGTGDTGGNGGTKVDCTLVECQSPRPDGEAGVAWDTCCTDSTVITTGGGGGEEDKCKLVECESPRPEGNLGALWDQCCKETPVTTTTGGGGDDGGNMFGSSGLSSFSPAGQPGMFDPTITAGVSLEQAMQFPIRDFLLEALPKTKKGMMTGNIV